MKILWDVMVGVGVVIAVPFLFAAFSRPEPKWQPYCSPTQRQ